MANVLRFRTLRHGEPRSLSRPRYLRDRWWNGSARLLGHLFGLVVLGAVTIVAQVLLGNGPDQTTRVPDSALIRVTAVDGDSLRSEGGEDIRLLGIDAPELYQTCRNASGREWACGREAHAALRALIARGEVRCRGSERDRYDRRLARCSAGSIADLGEAMVRDGLALNDHHGTYAQAEHDARRAQRGIWSGTFQRPAEYRDRRRAER
jgi:endonuclease YncB( thermonuclease family)